jgi:hypothetical protein
VNRQGFGEGALRSTRLGDLGGPAGFWRKEAAHHQRLYREPALPAAGINACGLIPDTVTEEEANIEHGNNERIRVEEVRRGPRILFDVVAAVAGEKQ